MRGADVIPIRLFERGNMARSSGLSKLFVILLVLCDDSTLEARIMGAGVDGSDGRKLSCRGSRYSSALSATSASTSHLGRGFRGVGTAGRYGTRRAVKREDTDSDSDQRGRQAQMRINAGVIHSAAGPEASSMELGLIQESGFAISAEAERGMGKLLDRKMVKGAGISLQERKYIGEFEEAPRPLLGIAQGREGSGSKQDACTTMKLRRSSRSTNVYGRSGEVEEKKSQTGRMVKCKSAAKKWNGNVFDTVAGSSAAMSNSDSRGEALRDQRVSERSEKCFQNWDTLYRRLLETRASSCLADSAKKNCESGRTSPLQTSPLNRTRVGNAWIRGMAYTRTLPSSELVSWRMHGDLLWNDAGVLESWLRKQKARHAAGKLGGFRTQMLHEAGVAFKPWGSKWDNFLCKLMLFKIHHGHCVVPYSSTNVDESLSSWVTRQRQRRKRARVASRPLHKEAN